MKNQAGNLFCKILEMKSPGKGIISNDTEEKRNALRRCGMPASIRADMTCFGRADVRMAHRGKERT
jgi:hypothetical protein